MPDLALGDCRHLAVQRHHHISSECRCLTDRVARVFAMNDALAHGSCHTRLAELLTCCKLNQAVTALRTLGLIRVFLEHFDQAAYFGLIFMRAVG